MSVSAFKQEIRYISCFFFVVQSVCKGENYRQQRYYLCPHCGGSLRYADITGQLRRTCQSCQRILYENSIVGVAAIVQHDQDKIVINMLKKQSDDLFDFILKSC